ncbi:MAG: hypothetical protein ACM3MF_08775 [Anaerolineae bacterium]
MKIGFTVGAIEQHRMELLFDQPTGDLRITMDGTPVLHDTPTLVRGPVKRYELKIGKREKHKLALQLTFEDERARLLEQEQSDPTYQLSFSDAPCDEQGEECPDWPVLVVPRFSLMVTAVGD